MNKSITIYCGNTSRIKVEEKEGKFEIISSKSSDSSVARVEKGFIIGGNAGEAKIESKIKFKDNEKNTLTTYVTVKPGRLSVKPEINTLAVGETVRLRTMVSNGVYKSISYQSTNINVASIECDGGYCFVKGVSEGAATIIISLNVGNIIKEERIEIEVKGAIKKELPISNPVDGSGYSVEDEWKGSRVYFGVFEQDGNIKNGKEPILWRVLEIKDDTILLLSEYGLICKYYHDRYEYVSWETSYIRRWLNTKFLDISFTKTEIDAIDHTLVRIGESKIYENCGGNNTIDKVFLLSKMAVINTKFGFTKDLRKKSKTRSLQITKYALNEGGYKSQKNNNTCWWLRSPGITNQYASYVLTSGKVTEAYFSGRRNDAIRPAIRIKRSAIMFGDNISDEKTSYPKIIVKDM